ncbi:I78 family peptidase inhibitor [Halomonas sp.]|uniref:I78 family peptidase inhibitor n=1 Tax=Halomonas sp. TaxID=1486246 RepID=UPI00384D94D8
MSFKLFPTVIAGLLLAGCAGLTSPPVHESAPPPPLVVSRGECGAAQVQDRVGREFSLVLGEAIRAESGAAAMRVIRPGEAVTLDYRPDSLNVRLDEGDVISEIGCG